MNLLYIIQLLQKIRSGYVPSTPITFIFGAKAAPAYIIAKDIIHAILCLQDIIAKRPCSFQIHSSGNGRKLQRN